jgi:hypothetical protein
LYDGETEIAIAKRKSDSSNYTSFAFDSTGRIVTPRSAEIRNAWLSNGRHKTHSFKFGESPEVIIEIVVSEQCVFSVELLLRQKDGIPLAFAPSGLACDWEVRAIPGTLNIRCLLPQLKLGVGEYSLDLIVADTGRGFFDYVESAVRFLVEEVAIGPRGWCFRQDRGQGAFLMDVQYFTEG